MKNRVNILIPINVTLMLLTLLTAGITIDIKFSFIFLSLFSLGLYLYESKKLESTLFDSMVLCLSFVLLLTMFLFSNDPFYLFVDDEYYFNNAKYEMLRESSDLFKSFLFERDTDFNNYLYFSTIFFKFFGYHQATNWIINFILLTRIFSFVAEAKTNVRKISFFRWVPLELIFFSFFLFKDILISFMAVEYFRYSLKNKLIYYLISSIILILILEPLRVGYAYIFIVIIGLSRYIDFGNFIKKYRLAITISVGYLAFQGLFNLTTAIVTDDLNLKLQFYRENLNDRIMHSSGLLSKIYSGFNSGNIIFVLPIVCLAVFIPILTIPDSGSEKILMVVRSVSFIQFFYFIFISRKNINIDSRSRITVYFIFTVLCIIHLTFAPGMLRHSLIILPFLYSALIHSKHEKINNIY